MRTRDDVPRARQPATVVAMLVVAVVAVLQTALIVTNMSAQRDAAHVIDISGSQRMRSQQLAYFALGLHVGHPEPDANATIERTISAMLATRADIKKHPQYVVGPIDGNAATPTSRMADHYFATVRALERDPGNEAAFAAMRGERTRLLEAFDSEVKMRVAIANDRNGRIVLALLLGLLLEIGCMIGVWFGIVSPAERRNARLISDVRHAREQIESIFAENPEPIAVHDQNGQMIRINPSRVKLLGHGATEVVGRDYTEFIVGRDVAESKRLFERALGGETVRMETQFLALDGSLVDVAMTMFPRVVDDDTTGVIIASKDLRQLHAAEAQNAEQARRLADLYEIASAHDRSTEEMLRSAIGLVAVRLGYDFGVVTEFSDDTVTVISTYGDPADSIVGESHSLRTSLAKLAVSPADVFEANDVAVSGMKIYIGGVLYGAAGFASRRVREHDLSEADIGFMRLACALLGTIVERARQMRHLDWLAHTDSLTGLANRTKFTTDISELIANGSPFALHYVDLDRFKTVNDNFGHAVGDAVLGVVAKRLEHCARSGDVVARVGGDEFAIVQTGPVDPDGAAALAQRIVDAFGGPIDLGDTQHAIGATVGVAIFPEDGSDTRAIVAAADGALYGAKRAGRNRVARAQRRALETLA